MTNAAKSAVLVAVVLAPSISHAFVAYYERGGEIVTGVIGAAGASGERVFHDGLESVAARLPSGSTNPITYRFDAWGGFQDGSAWPGAGEPSLAYAGHSADADVELSYAQQRWYDPGTGRWLSPDPVFGDLADPNSLMTWGYANGNPTRYTDPTGEAVCIGNPDECREMYGKANRLKSALPTFSAQTVVQGGNATLSIEPMGGFGHLEFVNPVNLAGYRTATSSSSLYGVVTSGNLQELADLFVTLKQGEPVQQSSATVSSGVVKGALLQQATKIPSLVNPLALAAVDPKMLGLSKAEVDAYWQAAQGHNEYVTKMYNAGVALGVGANVAVSATAVGDALAAGKAAAAATERAATLEASQAAEAQRLGSVVEAQQARAAVAGSVSNPIPERLARVIPGNVVPTMLGRPGSADVFVTAADDIAGMTPAQIAKRLTIPESRSFTVIEFPTPAEGLASPVFRSNTGFVGGGRTSGGAREFVIRNGPIPEGATIRRIDP
jgi:RHS repeat-associated protein